MTTDRELVLARVFDAPREVVFKAWTNVEHLKRWWGPKNFTNPVCEVDVRPGGAMRIHMRGPDGTIYPMTGVFQEIDHRSRQRSRRPQIGLELGQFGLVREPLVPEEIDDFLITDLAGELVDVVAGVDENAFIPEDVTETGGGGNDPLQSRRGNGHNLQLTSRVPLCH